MFLVTHGASVSPTEASQSRSDLARQNRKQTKTTTNSGYRVKK